METVTQKGKGFIDGNLFFPVHFEDIRYVPIGDYLSLGEIALYGQIPVSKQKDRLAGRYSAKRVLQEYTKREYARDVVLRDIIITSHPGAGVSFVISGDTLERPMHLSISHCNERGVAVLDPAPIGVDIEEIRIFREETLCAFLTHREKTFLGDVSGRDNSLVATLFWSLKEAYLKALGKGITIHPQTVEISLGRELQFQGLFHNGVPVPVWGEWGMFDSRHILTGVKIL